MNVNPNISYSIFNFYGNIRLNADVKAEFNTEAQQCTGTHCDFTRNNTNGDFLARELIHTKFNGKVASQIDQPFKAAFEAYLHHSDFWPTVVKFVEDEKSQRQAQASLEAQTNTSESLHIAAVTNLFNKGNTVSQIADILEITNEKVLSIIAKI